MTQLASNHQARTALLEAADYWGISIGHTAVCKGHQDPLSFVASWLWDRPSVSLVLGPRGGGKSFLAALATHLDSMRYTNHGTRILGGSLAQSEQIYNALRTFDRSTGERSPILSISAERAKYSTGSDVAILAASQKSVRGPHVATLRLDEVDEILPDVRESAIGMCMDRNGVSGSICMTSTWHRPGGPMSILMKAGRSGVFPVFEFCSFEVLERCPTERSGTYLENCPECPIQKWCHADIEETGLPKAKRSSGHYAIDSLIQKVQAVSLRVFEADYLCMGPRADGLWFTTFDKHKHVNIDAEYNPNLPVSVAVDSGVRTGAVMFQAWTGRDGTHQVNVFGDYFCEGLSAEMNAREILKVCWQLCNGRIDRCTTDPSGGSREAVGPPVFSEYLRAGLADSSGRLEGWPSYAGSVRGSLELLEGLLMSAFGTVNLHIHPRCINLIMAFENYLRAKVAGVFMDRPLDPQHPFEDMIDSLRGGVLDKWPEGRVRQNQSRLVRPSQVF